MNTNTDRGLIEELKTEMVGGCGNISEAALC